MNSAATAAAPTTPATSTFRIVIASSVESHAFRGASRRYFARKTVFTGALAAL